jgi:hypothetical protein
VLVGSLSLFYVRGVVGMRLAAVMPYLFICAILIILLARKCHFCCIYVLWLNCMCKLRPVACLGH